MYVLRGIDETKSFRFFAANTTQVVNDATSSHVTSPLASVALGRTLSGVILMSQMNKNPSDRVSVLIKGDGPIGGIIVEANGMGDAKGYVYNPDVELPKNSKGMLDVSGAIGNAIMTVTKDTGLREPSVGQTAMLSGEIAEDFADYFAISEQTNTAVILGVLIDKDHTIKQAGGIIIQVLPEASDEAITELENKIKTFSSLTEHMEKGQTIEQIVEELLGNIEIMAKTDIAFKCDCCRERMERALISLGKQELTSIVQDEQEDIELVCHFCNSKYPFDKNDIQYILDSI
ncbi:MAG: heat-shock protein Hsp33 [Epulopiscium sp. Nele67-Bin002]|nr:MAG: molecular chaperone Hsp33 [Epulopiscium sp. Nuni2H_MBin001]OON91263.1 MAG: heat-shock protein Hsp33 [Epulopiscium sp. Nele67-Bin002]